MKRILISISLLLFIGIVAFYSWGSSGLLDSSQLSSKIVYHKNYKKSFDTVSVITYNLGYLSGMTNNLAVTRTEALFEENLKRSGSLLGDLDADIVAFQEIDFSSKRSYHCNQLDSLAYATAYPVAVKAVNWDKNYVPYPYWPPTYHFGRMLSGQAVLSKYTMNPVETITLDKPFNTSFFYSAFYLNRLVQVVRIQAEDLELVLMNVHLEAFDKETRIAHARKVKNLFEKYAAHDPVLLIGDFNSEAEYVDTTDGLQIIMSAKNIQSAIDETQYTSSLSRTFPSKDPALMIDYILFNNDRIKKVEAKVVTEAGQISDHLPVMMTFVLN